jgi:hypothetical protein
VSLGGMDGRRGVRGLVLGFGRGGMVRLVGLVVLGGWWGGVYKRVDGRVAWWGLMVWLRARRVGLRHRRGRELVFGGLFSSWRAPFWGLELHWVRYCKRACLRSGRWLTTNDIVSFLFFLFFGRFVNLRVDNLYLVSIWERFRKVKWGILCSRSRDAFGFLDSESDAASGISLVSEVTEIEVFARAAGDDFLPRHIEPNSLGEKSTYRLEICDLEVLTGVVHHFITVPRYSVSWKLSGITAYYDIVLH